MSTPLPPLRLGLRPDDLAALREEAGAARLPPRRRLYGIGMGKTGTNALASLFAGVPAAHEAGAEDLIDAVLDYESGRTDGRGLRDLVIARDARLGLEVDVSNLNIFLVDLLVAMDGDAKFVLTVRDPRSWLESIMNHYLQRPPTARWRAMADHRFGGGGPVHPPEERALAERGLYPLSGYLRYWRAHLDKAIEAVPAERLLVVPTERIADEADRIAAFAGFRPESVDRSRIREYRNSAKEPILASVPADHLEERIRTHCGSIGGRDFPEFLPVGPSTPR